MVNDRQLGSYTELTLKKENQFVGDRVRTFYCVKCGYIELYRQEEKQMPTIFKPSIS